MTIASLRYGTSPCIWRDINESMTCYVLVSSNQKYLPCHYHAYQLGKFWVTLQSTTWMKYCHTSHSEPLFSPLFNNALRILIADIILKRTFSGLINKNNDSQALLFMQVNASNPPAYTIKKLTCILSQWRLWHLSVKLPSSSGRITLPSKQFILYHLHEHWSQGCYENSVPEKRDL